jgi:hypothetical protein
MKDNFIIVLDVTKKNFIYASGLALLVAYLLDGNLLFLQTSFFAVKQLNSIFDCGKKELLLNYKSEV